MAKKRRMRQAPASPGTYPVMLWWGMGLYFVLAGACAFAVPLWTAPDEGVHYQYVHYLMDHHRFPVFDTKDRIFYESHQPPLYYLLSVPVAAAAEHISHSAAGYALRLCAVLLGGINLFVCWQILRLLLRDEDAARGGLLFFALLPMQLYVSASISNDVLVGLWCSLAFYFAVKMAQGDTEARTAAFCGGTLGLAMLTKSTGLYFIPVGVAGALLTPAASRPRWRNAAIVLALALLLPAPWLIRNTVLYGDPLVLHKFKQVFAGNPHPSYFLDRGMSLGAYIVFVAHLTWINFWGIFGEINAAIRRLGEMAAGDPHAVRPLYLLLVWTFTLGSFAAVVGHVWWRRENREPDRRSWLLAYLAIGIVLFGYVQFNCSFFQAQARYLHPVLPAVAAVFGSGLTHLGRKRGGALWLGIPAGAMLLVSLLDLTVWR